jgi:hypothetical protein
MENRVHGDLFPECELAATVLKRTQTTIQGVIPSGHGGGIHLVSNGLFRVWPRSPLSPLSPLSSLRWLPTAVPLCGVPDEQTHHPAGQHDLKVVTVLHLGDDEGQ